MKYRRDYCNRYRLRSALAVGLLAAGLFVALGNATWAERFELAEPSQSAVNLIPEDLGWLPGETPVPGVFPNAPVDDLGAERIHYVDAASVKRTSVLVYMDPSISKRAAPAHIQDTKNPYYWRRRDFRTLSISPTCTDRHARWTPQARAIDQPSNIHQ